MQGSFESRVELQWRGSGEAWQDEGGQEEDQREECVGRPFTCWLQLEDITFLLQSRELSSCPCSWDHERQMLRKSLPGTACHKLHDSFLSPCQCHERLVVSKFVIRHGAQGDVKTGAPSLALAPFLFKQLEGKWDFSFSCHAQKKRWQLQG